MKTWHVIVIAISVMVAALLNGGIYEIVPSGQSGVWTEYGGVYKLNRFTGGTWHISTHPSGQPYIQ